MKKTKGRCKFCGTDVTLNLFDPGRQWFSEKWLVDMAACNRCADFMEKRRGIHENVRRLVVQWSRHTSGAKPEDLREPLQGHRKVLKDGLTAMMKDWLATMNEYFKTNIAWDESVMNLLLDKNTNVNTVLLQCERMLRQETPVAALRVGRAVFPIQ